MSHSATNDSESAAEVRRILVRSTNWVGDTVLITPAIHALRCAYPRAQIAVLAVRAVADLLTYHPDVDEILVYERTGRHQGYRGMLVMAGELNREKFTHAFVMPNSFSSALMIRLAAIPHRIGYGIRGREWLLTDSRPLPREILGHHQIYYYLGILRSGERAYAVPEPRIVVTEEESGWAAERLQRDGIRPEDRPCGLVPGATYGTAKQWPPDRFIEIGKRLVAVGKQVVLFGNEKERELTFEVSQAIGEGCLDMGGRTNMRQFMALLSRCGVVICNDSGAMHVAAALGCRIVVPIGSTDPYTTRPWGQGHVLIRHAMPCSPCLERHCPLGHHLCMERIRVEEVWAGVRRALAGSS